MSPFSTRIEPYNAMLRGAISYFDFFMARIFYFARAKLISNVVRLPSHGPPRGLKNLGNTCFMNAILQAMSSCPTLVASCEDLLSSSKKGNSVTEIVVNVMRGVRRPGGEYSINPREVLRRVQSTNSMFHGTDQHDALELFQVIMELIDKERASVMTVQTKLTVGGLAAYGTSRLHAISTRRPPSVGNSLANPCQGLLSRHLKCLHCQSVTGHSGWKSVKYEPFSTLPLTIPTTAPSSISLDPNLSPTSVTGLGGGSSSLSVSPPRISKEVSLYACMDYFLLPEQRSDINCESCTVARIAQALAAGEAGSGGCFPDSLPIKRLVSSGDAFITDIGDDDVEDYLLESHGFVHDMLYGASKSKYVVKQTMSYSTAFARFPSILCFHLSRQVSDRFGNVRKVGTKVSFPVELDMNRYVRTAEGNDAVPTVVSTDKAYSKLNMLCSDASSSSCSSLISSVVKGNSGVASNLANRIANYLLRAVVVHTGTENSGHYTAFCLLEDSPKRKWGYFSDERVDEVDEAQVLNCQAYMLFYDRIRPK